jgi:hypothetical protein
MPRYISKGTCSLCKGTFNKSGMTRHLQMCQQRNAATTPAGKRKPQPTKHFHLVVEGRYLPMYWMHLNVPADLTLADFDAFLRDIWLECCGHLSAFEIEGVHYNASSPYELGIPYLTDTPDEPSNGNPAQLPAQLNNQSLGEVFAEVEDKDLEALIEALGGFHLPPLFQKIRERDMNVTLGEVLKPSMKFYHEYDFGSTTHLTIKVVAEREGLVNKKDPFQILAQNDPPEILCSVCGQPAAYVCSVCSWEAEGWLCKKCARKHECGEEMLLPVVNSPRVGVCGYGG